jgi:hypothetical protein
MDIGSIAAWVAVVPTTIGAGVAIYNANKSQSAARDAKDALATALRPIFAFTMASALPLEQGGPISIEIINTGSFAAVDFTARITANGGRVVGECSAQRIPGKVPGTLFGGPDLTIDLHDVAPGPGDTLRLNITARSTDQRGLQQWEQRAQITLQVEQTGPVGKIRLTPVSYDHGEPTPYFGAKSK